MNQKDKRFSKVVAIIDPQRMIQPALIKGEEVARNNDADLQLYCCVYDEELEGDRDAQQLELDLTQEWIERLVAPARAAGLDITVDLEWNREWRGAVVNAATRNGADLLIKTASRHSAIGRRLMKTSDWLILKEVKCNVLLVSATQTWKNKTLLAAIKLKPEDEPHERLNERIIDLSHRIAEGAGLEMHAMTAYRGEDAYFDRQEFAGRCNLPRSRVHSAAGTPHHGIAKVAKEIGADVIVVGNPGEAAKSDTARMLIDQVNVDVFVVPYTQA